MPEEAIADTTTPSEEHKRKGLNPQRKAAVMLTSLSLLGFLLGLRWIVDTRSNLTTDNAFVESNVYPVAARIPGTVINVMVQDNQFVRKGDLLVLLDPTDYRLASEKAAAAVGVALNETSSDGSQVAAARATLQAANARHQQSLLDLKRGETLFNKEVIPKEQLERLKTAYLVADAQVQEATQQLKRAEALAGFIKGTGNDARVREKKAQLEESRTKLSYTRIIAPADGYVTRKGVEIGATIQPGQALMAVVPLSGIWITANYKESQLTHIKTGQKVSFTVDSYPGRVFNGKVESLMAGTGAAFSLLPPENATGNYVKVVQRIPIRITIDRNSDPEHLLRVGMSVVPVIHTGRTTLQILKELNPFK